MHQCPVTVGYLEGVRRNFATNPLAASLELYTERLDDLLERANICGGDDATHRVRAFKCIEQSAKYISTIKIVNSGEEGLEFIQLLDLWKPEEYSWAALTEFLQRLDKAERAVVIEKTDLTLSGENKIRTGTRSELMLKASMRAINGARDAVKTLRTELKEQPMKLHLVGGKLAEVADAVGTPLSRQIEYGNELLSLVVDTIHE